MSEAKGMTDVQKKALEKKLVVVVNHLSSLEDEKKAWNSSLAEQIKETKARVRSVCRALKKDDIQELSETFSPTELEEMFKQMRADAKFVVEA